MIIENAPGVSESFQYHLPFYDLADKPFIALASQKQHISFYLNEPVLIQQFVSKLGKVNAGKNCLRFKHFNKVDKAKLAELIQIAYRKRTKTI